MIIGLNAQIMPEKDARIFFFCRSARSKTRFCRVLQKALVYKEGLTHIKTATDSSSGSGANYRKGTAETSGTHQTALSKLAAPPEGRVLTKFCGAVAAISGVLAWLFLSWWLALIAVGSAVGMIRVWKPEAEQYTNSMERWRKLRMCQRCGHLYTPKE
jgi:hypothetical protein